MTTFLGISMFVLTGVAAVWLGKKLEHLFFTLVGCIVLLVIGGFIKEGTGLVFLLIIGTLGGLVIVILQIKDLIVEFAGYAEDDKRRKNLFIAIANGDVATAKTLLTDTTIKFKEYGTGRSLLTIAVQNGNKEMVSLLIEKGSNVNDFYDHRPLLDLSEDNEIKELLRSHGAKTKDELDAEAEEAYNTGSAYFHGEGVAQDYEKAVEFLEKAANLENMYAQCDLAICYLYGLGVEQNKYIGYSLSKKSAEQGYANGQYVLGCCYNNGDGIKQDFREAASWYRLAAEQGFAPAQYALGDLYYWGRGFGGSMDYQSAGEWWEKAANQGYEEALSKLRELCETGLYRVKKIQNEDMARALGIL